MGNRKSAIEFHTQAVSTANDKSNPQNLQVAYSLFGSSVIADPTFAEGWFQVGNANGDLGLLAASVAAYRQALALPDGPLPGDMNKVLRCKALVNLGHRLHAMGLPGEAREATMSAIYLDDKSAYAWCNLSLIEGLECRLQESIDAAERAFKIDQSPTIECALAFAHLFGGNLATGLKHFESRFAYKLHQFLLYPYPKWDGASGKMLYLVSDQGLGDTLSFSRFLPAVAAKCQSVVAVVQPELMRLFREMFWQLPNVDFVPAPAPFLPADAWSTFVSLPVALGLSDDQIRDAIFPIVPRFSIPGNWKNEDAKFHVAIAYGGSPLNDIDRHRSIPVTQFLELSSVPGVQLYSLQVGDRVKDLHDNGCAAIIRDLAPFIRDVSDTMAILSELDLVITIESALGHIASLMGKECWIPYSYLGRDYRAGPRGETPIWSPNHRFFPQGPDASWKPVFYEIRNALTDKVIRARDR